MDAVRRWLGIGAGGAPDRDKVLAGFGAALTILVVHLLGQQLAGGVTAAILVPSMGATAVLLFAAPESPLSQPWSVVAGHVVSAVVGVGCARAIPSRELAAAAAVGGALVAMQLLRCLHPPGGATALAAVIAGPAVSSLGWSYVLRPVAVDAVLVVAIAIAVHAALTDRRYPTGGRDPRRSAAGAVAPPAPSAAPSTLPRSAASAPTPSPPRAPARSVDAEVPVISTWTFTSGGGGTASVGVTRPDLVHDAVRSALESERAAHGRVGSLWGGPTDAAPA